MKIQHLNSGDLALMHGFLDCLGEAFELPVDYGANRPDDAYLTELLADPGFVALAALDGAQVVGGLAAYVLRKFEQPRSEVYIYDLAVRASHRRQGIATALIEALRPIARDRGAWVIFVQADHGDAPAIALYESLGEREDVLHFDVPVE